MKRKMLLVGAAMAGLTLAGTGCKQNTSGSGASQGSSGPQSVTSMGECHGINTCKGTGACASKVHSCAGNNTCKGQGWLKLSQQNCEGQGGRFVKSAAH